MVRMNGACFEGWLLMPASLLILYAEQGFTFKLLRSPWCSHSPRND